MTGEEYMDPAFELFGRKGEELVREWLKTEGWCVIPASLIDNGGAPMLESHVRQYILPDILAAKAGVPRWVEVKTKGRWTDSRERRRPETGCELRHWRHYLAVQRNTGIRGAMAFVHVRERRLLIGELDVIGEGAAEWLGPFKPGHAFKEPMIFFAVDRFDCFYLEESCLFQLISMAKKPETVRPWENKRAPQDRQKFLSFMD